MERFAAFSFLLLLAAILCYYCSRGARRQQMHESARALRTSLVRSGMRDASDVGVQLASDMRRAWRKKRANHAVAEEKSEDDIERTRVLSKNIRRAPVVLTGVPMSNGIRNIAVSGGRYSETKDEDEDEDEGQRQTTLQRFKNKVRILLSLAQLVSTMEYNMSVEFPTTFSKFLSFLRVVVLDFGWLPLDCFLSRSYYGSLASVTLGSIAVAFFLFSCDRMTRKEGESEDNFYFFLLLNFMYFMLPGCSSTVRFFSPPTRSPIC